MYGFVVWLRNLLYDEHLLPTYTVKTPTICVGNLAVGGTGKTPHVEYLIRLLTGQGYRVAVVSLGYKRHSTGFVLAGPNSTAAELGDEPMQIHTKFPDVPVAVCKNRVHAIRQLERRVPGLNCVILDDAMQYRRLRCGFNILLTACDNLYSDDKFLPWGTLRDSRNQALRANAVVVTRCPKDMSAIERRVVSNRLKLPQFQYLYFSHVEYEAEVAERLRGKNVLLVTGIANPRPVQDFVQSVAKSMLTLSYSDHHEFSRREVAEMHKQLETCDVIATTEKDYARLVMRPDMEDILDRIVPLPIRVYVDTESAHFDREVIRYVFEHNRTAPGKTQPESNDKKK